MKKLFGIALIGALCSASPLLANNNGMNGQPGKNGHGGQMGQPGQPGHGGKHGNNNPGKHGNKCHDSYWEYVEDGGHMSYNDWYHHYYYKCEMHDYE